MIKITLQEERYILEQLRWASIMHRAQSKNMRVPLIRREMHKGHADKIKKLVKKLLKKEY